jgi:hypothetical protein
MSEEDGVEDHPRLDPVDVVVGDDRKALRDTKVACMKTRLPVLLAVVVVEVRLVVAACEMRCVLFE